MEGLAGHDLLNQFPQAIPVSGHGRDNPVNIVAIRETDPATQGVDEEFFCQAAGELFRSLPEVIADPVRPIDHGSVRHFSGCINGQPLAIAIAPAAEEIVVFHREAERIDPAVAFETGGIFPVLPHLLPDGGHAAGIGFDWLDVRGRRVGWGAKEVLQNPDTSQDGLGLHPIRGGGENASLSQQPATMMFGFQADALEPLVIDVRDVIVPGQGGVEERVIGVNELKDAPVLRKEMLEIASGLLAHGGFNIVGVVGSVLLRVWRHFSQFAEVEPLLDKVLGEARGSGVLEHPFHL